MPGKYEGPFTIESAIQKIAQRQYLLPSIQRNFTWDTEQICVLFDSIMRNYPVNSLMLWRVESNEIHEGFRFYSFLEKYVERFAESNLHFDTKGHGSFHAVIDGQQRLTSLYIGLKGTYANKRFRVRWPRAYDPIALPPMKLFLNIKEELDSESNDNLMRYDFRFLTAKQVSRLAAEDPDSWFEVGQILSFPTVEMADDALDIVDDFLSSTSLAHDKFARKTLLRLYHAIRVEPSLTAYVETNQEIDHVLDIFIRTNKGGTRLSASDLLMSITAANWEDARENVDELVNQIRTDIGFSIDRDFVMKAVVTATDGEVRLRVKSFDASSVAKIRDDWAALRGSIVAAFHLVSSFGLNDASLRAKNAVIPIVYYLYHKGRGAEGEGPALYQSINSPIRHREDRNAIRQWLFMTLLRRVFGSGGGDTLLTNLRGVIRDNLESSPTFPLAEIVARFAESTKDLTFDDQEIEILLRTQKDDSSCYSILALLQPGLDINQILHLDHLHPAATFTRARLDTLPYLDDPQTRQYYDDPANWNSVANLHLLSEAENTSKQDKPLDDWMESQRGFTLVDPLIPPETDLDFAAFPAFMEARAKLLGKMLRVMVGRSHQVTSNGEVLSED